MIEFTTPIHKTNILPLRWFANLCNHLSAPFLTKAVRLHHIAEDENKSVGFMYHFYGFMYNLIDKPYRLWGTTYEVDMDAWRKSVWGEGIDPDAIDKLRSDEVLGRLGSDYDENGIPYWEKWHTDGN